MKSFSVLIFLVFTACFILGGNTGMYAQGTDTTDTDTETTENIRNGEEYLRARTKALDKYLCRSSRIQRKLLKKLKKSEGGLAAKLAGKDTALYAQYSKDPLTYDSIRALAEDSAFYNKGSPRQNTLIDSLKGIQDFIRNQKAKLNGMPLSGEKSGTGNEYAEKLNSLEKRLNAQQQLQALISQRGDKLQNLVPNGDIPGIRSIQKEIFYAQGKLKSWKQLADDPDATEEKALEYLQGVEGFEQSLKSGSTAFGGLGNDATAAQLESMGYQTKAQVNSMLEQKFGDNLVNVQGQMGQQVQQYQEGLNNIKGKVTEAKNSYAHTKETLNASGEIKDNLTHLEKPSFKVSPMRSIPFWQRIKFQYNFQTSKGIRNERPAMLDLGASVIYQQAKKWRYGIGAAGSIGLGPDWQNLHLSYEGISFRVFVDRELLFGLHIEGGFEQIYRPLDRVYVHEATKEDVQGSGFLKQSFGGKQQTAYIGLMKSYRINKKWNGTFMLGYDFLWQRYGMHTPLLVRFGWEK